MRQTSVSRYPNRWFVTVVLAGLLNAGAAAAANSSFDPVIHGLQAAPFTLDNNGAARALWNRSASVFREGDKVGINCNTGGAPGNKDDKYENFTFHFFVDGKLLTSLSRQKNADRVDAPVWTAAGIGTHTLECRVDAYAPGNKANDSANAAIVVKPNVPGEPGVMYYGNFGYSEAPKFTSPDPGQRFVLRRNLTIGIRATVPGDTYTVAWAKQTPYDERWHVDVVRRGSGAFAAAEALVVQDAGALTAHEFGTTLGEWFMKNAGPGQYAVRVYFSQKRPDGYFESARSRIEFEIVEPARGERVDAPPATSATRSVMATGAASASTADSAAAPVVGTSSRPAATSADTDASSAVAAARVLGALRQSAISTFAPPLVDGQRVDLCLHWGSDCGQPAADAFCTKNGHVRAVEFTVANDIGAQSPTLVMGDGQLCADAFCDGFAVIRCAN